MFLLFFDNFQCYRCERKSKALHVEVRSITVWIRVLSNNAASDCIHEIQSKLERHKNPPSVSLLKGHSNSVLRQVRTEQIYHILQVWLAVNDLVEKDVRIKSSSTSIPTIKVFRLLLSTTDTLLS